MSDQKQASESNDAEAEWLKLARRMSRKPRGKAGPRLLFAIGLGLVLIGLWWLRYLWSVGALSIFLIVFVVLLPICSGGWFVVQGSKSSRS